MAFTKPQPRVPASIGSIVITLRDTPASGNRPASQKIEYELQILDDEGVRIVHPLDAGDLEPHLTPQQITAVKSFMTAMRQLAVAGIIGE